VKTALFTKIFAERDVDEAIDLAAEIGYDGVEPMGRDPHLGPDTSPERAAEIGDRVDERGLDIPCIATYTGGYVTVSEAEREAELADLEKFLRLADALDCDLLRHGAGGPPVHEATEEDFEMAATWMRRAADLAAEYDKTLAMEIHAHRLTETADSTLKLLEMVDRENVGAIHDAGNMYIVDTDFGPRTVDKLGDKLFHVHVKDERRVDDPSLPGAFELETRHGPELLQPRLLGEGAVDHRPLFRALRDAGYDGYASAECHVPMDDPDADIDVAEHEREVLREYIADAERSRADD
jgi:sugar phosphate isomerase/epimerase